MIRRAPYPVGGSFFPPIRLSQATPGRMHGLGLWPFTSGLTSESLTPLGELNSVKGQSLYSSSDTQVFGPGYVAAAGNVVASIPAGSPLGVITDYGWDSNGVLWWYLEVSGTEFAYVGKILGGHVYVQDDPSVTFSTGPTPSTGAEIGGAAGKAAKDILKKAAEEFPAGAIFLILGAVAFFMLYRPAGSAR